MTSVLPQIGTVSNVPDDNNNLDKQSNVRKSKGKPSLLEISQNIQTIRQENVENRFRSKSMGNRNKENRKRKSKVDRSRSLGHGDQNQIKPHRKYVFDIKTNSVSQTEPEVDSRGDIGQKSPQPTSADKRVRFNSRSEEYPGPHNTGFKRAPQTNVKTTGVQYKINGSERNGVRMGARSPTLIYQGSPKGPRRLATLASPKRRGSPKRQKRSGTGATVDAKSVQYQLTGSEKNGVLIGESSPEPESDRSSPKGSPRGSLRTAVPGTHHARLEAARTRARIWAETYSDPGPTYNEKAIKSIDNEKVIRGRPLDKRPNRLSHQGQVPPRDERPSGADKRGRPPRSLPAAKEQHASMQDRSVISAPSKEQQPNETPMPKINTLVKDTSPHKPASTTTEVSPKPKPTEEVKHPPAEKNKSPDRKPVETTRKSPEKTSEKAAARSPSKSPEKPVERTVVQKEKTAVHVPGLSGRNSQEADRESKRSEKTPSVTEDMANKPRETKRKLPPDDHGPVEPPRQSPVKSETKGRNSSSDKSDKDFNYYASVKQKEEEERRRKEREAEFKKEMEKQLDVSPPKRIQSEKSAKTDKSWSTMKTADTKASSVSPTKSKTSYELSQSPSTDRNKRREVTIVDPKTQYDTDESGGEAEAVTHEYEYGHGELHKKDFNEMTEEEKQLYFRNHMKMKPEQIRELTFHPKITQTKSIHRAYTGIDTGNWSSIRSRSGKRPKSRKVTVYKKIQTIAPHQRKTFIYSRLQGVVYRHINDVYGNSPRETREKRFFEKLTKLQVDNMQRRYEQLADRERRKFEAKLRQRDQLKRLRRKFEDDAWRRFMTQYVTSKVVEAEYRNAQEYGLPNELRQERQRTYHGTGNRTQYTLTPRTRQKSNFKKYQNLFRYNMGPEFKPGGKPMKFEGFDTVDIDTEDEHEQEEPEPGKPQKKRQNVEDLMKEAMRILDQSDDDTDVEITPRHEQRRHYRPPVRPQRHRARSDIRDDKSTLTSTTRTATTKPRSVNRPPPRTMKEMLQRRQAPANRYKASGFSNMKDDLIKDSAKLNKNENLKKATSAYSETTRTDEKEKEKNTSSTDRNVQTPSQSPVPAKSVTTTVTKTTTTTHETVDSKQNAEIVSTTSRFKVKEGNVYLDEAETQMAIETARDKQNEDKQVKQPSRAPSRISKISTRQDQNPTSESPSKMSNKINENKIASRAPSRVSIKSQLDNNQQKDLPPVRAPSRSSVVSKESKTTTDATTKTSQPQRRFSKASIAPPILEAPKVEQDIETKSIISRQSPAERRQSSQQDDEPVNEPKDNLKQVESRRNSEMSLQTSQYRKPSTVLVSRNMINNSQVSVKETNERNGRVNNNENDKTSPTRRSESKQQLNGNVSPVKAQSETGSSKQTVSKSVTVTENTTEKSRVNGTDKPRQSVTVTENKTEKSRVSGTDKPRQFVAVTENTSEKHRVNGTDKPRQTVTKSVNIDESTTETTRSEVSKNTQKIVRRASQKPEKKVTMENTDLFLTQRATYHDRKKETPTPKPRQKQGPKGRKASRSRTPVRKQSKMNGHDPPQDITMDMNEYEQKGRARKQQVSRNESPRARKRSTSRGRGARKRSTSRGSKRSLSRDRKGKSRFPDIQKKGGKWEITARKESVHEEETVRVITPQPKTENQWKSLVEKYMRQPSPKIGKTDDRSLLDSNPDDDDDEEMDIFKRASMRYNLSMSGGEDNNDSDSDV